MTDKDFLYEAGQAIVRARKMRGMSQSMLANLCGMDPSNLSVIENGGTNPRLLTILKLAVALEMPFNELFDFDFEYRSLMESKPVYQGRKHKK